MGEVFNFPVRKSPEKPTDPNVDFNITNEDNLVRFLEKYTNMLIFLTKLGKADPKSINIVNIGLRRPTQASNEELIGWVMNSEPNDWKLHPSFYHAVHKEVDERKIIPQ